MLKVNKKVIGSLEKCYSLAMLNYQGRDHFLCNGRDQSLGSIDMVIEWLGQEFHHGPHCVKSPYFGLRYRPQA